MTRCTVRVARLVAAGFTLALVAATGTRPAEAQFPPEELTNLQVFPEDIPVRELISHMRRFSAGLGVRCQYCHVGEPGAELSTYDFASDDKPAKRKARTMFRMTEDLNGVYLAGLESRSDPPLEITCATCHHGLSRPVTLQQVLVAKATEEGAAAALAEYRALREAYYGTFSYDFSEGVLVEVAQEIGRQDLAGAIEILDANVELFPSSVQTHLALGQAHERNGDVEAAIRHVERALELSPGDRRIQQLLDRLRGEENA